MVGVGHRAGHDIPCLIPAEALFIHEDAHEFGAAHGGVRVVGVDGDVAGQFIPSVTMLALKGVEKRADTSRDKQVLLLEAK